MNIIEGLRKSKEIIEQGFWIKGAYNSYGPRGGRHCAIGAVRKIEGLERVGIEDSLREANYQTRRSASVEAFNDHPNTSKEDILELFDFAICREECKAQEK